MRTLFTHFFVSSILLIGLFCLGANAYSDDLEVRDHAAISQVNALIKNKDCAGAIRLLNEGITKKNKDILLTAGVLYEEGICLKQNWQQASVMYQSAHAAGSKFAIPHLVAGYAAPGREPAAAIWWAAQYKVIYLKECRPNANPITETDTFIAELNSWPKGQLEACAYSLGVTFYILGDTEFPDFAAMNKISDELEILFQPAKGTITWAQIMESGATTLAFTSSQSTNDQAGPTTRKNILLKYAESVGQLSLRRYPKPSGIDPKWKINFQLSFQRLMYFK